MNNGIGLLMVSVLRQNKPLSTSLSQLIVCSGLIRKKYSIVNTWISTNCRNLNYIPSSRTHIYYKQ